MLGERVCIYIYTAHNAGTHVTDVGTVSCVPNRGPVSAHTSQEFFNASGKVPLECGNLSSAQQTQTNTNKHKQTHVRKHKHTQTYTNTQTRVRNIFADMHLGKYIYMMHL